jgi:hypothetical protein
MMEIRAGTNLIIARAVRPPMRHKSMADIRPAGENPQVALGTSEQTVKYPFQDGKVLVRAGITKFL